MNTRSTSRAGRPVAPAGDVPFAGTDDDRPVYLDDEDIPVLPDQTRDDTDLGWGDGSYSNDDRLREDRPPHWA